MGKTFDGAERVAGLHRYDVARGFVPATVQLAAWRVEDVLGPAAVTMGGPPSVVWRSETEQDWAGPPAVWASWS